MKSKNPPPSTPRSFCPSQLSQKNNNNNHTTSTTSLNHVSARDTSVGQTNNASSPLSLDDEVSNLTDEVSFLSQKSAPNNKSMIVNQSGISGNRRSTSGQDENEDQDDDEEEEKLLGIGSKNGKNQQQQQNWYRPSVGALHVIQEQNRQMSFSPHSKHNTNMKSNNNNKNRALQQEGEQQQPKKNKILLLSAYADESNGVQLSQKSHLNNSSQQSDNQHNNSLTYEKYNDEGEENQQQEEEPNEVDLSADCPDVVVFVGGRPINNAKCLNLNALPTWSSAEMRKVWTQLAAIGKCLRDVLEESQAMERQEEEEEEAAAEEEVFGLGRIRIVGVSSTCFVGRCSVSLREI